MSGETSKLENALLELRQSYFGEGGFVYNEDENIPARAGDRLDSTWAELCLANKDESWLDDLRKQIAHARALIADDLFYSFSRCEAAIKEYTVALSIDSSCRTALSGLIAVHLQGNKRRPDKALPHALRLVELYPSRKREQDVAYIKSLME